MKIETYHFWTRHLKPLVLLQRKTKLGPPIILFFGLISAKKQEHMGKYDSWNTRSTIYEHGTDFSYFLDPSRRQGTRKKLLIQHSKIMKLPTINMKETTKRFETNLCCVIVLNLIIKKKILHLHL